MFRSLFRLPWRSAVLASVCRGRVCLFDVAVSADQSDSDMAEDEKAEKEFGLKRKYTVRKLFRSARDKYTMP